MNSFKVGDIVYHCIDSGKDIIPCEFQVIDIPEEPKGHIHAKAINSFFQTNATVFFDNQGPCFATKKEAWQWHKKKIEKELDVVLEELRKHTESVSAVICNLNKKVGITEAALKKIEAEESEKEKIYNNGNWRKNLFSVNYYDALSGGFVGWDKCESGKPYEVCMEVVKGQDISSFSMACAFDDIAEDYFYYRDFTDSGIPAVPEGDKYKCMFVFKKRSDFKKFKDLFCRIRVFVS